MGSCSLFSFRIYSNTICAYKLFSFRTDNGPAVYVIFRHFGKVVDYFRSQGLLSFSTYRGVLPIVFGTSTKYGFCSTAATYLLPTHVLKPENIQFFHHIILSSGEPLANNPDFIIDIIVIGGSFYFHLGTIWLSGLVLVHRDSCISSLPYDHFRTSRQYREVKWCNIFSGYCTVSSADSQKYSGMMHSILALLLLWN